MAREITLDDLGDSYRIKLEEALIHLERISDMLTDFPSLDGIEDAEQSVDDAITHIREAM